jgi:uncharacterized membrane protein YgcG
MHARSSANCQVVVDSPLASPVPPLFLDDWRRDTLILFHVRRSRWNANVIPVLCRLNRYSYKGLYVSHRRMRLCCVRTSPVREIRLSKKGGNLLHQGPQARLARPSRRRLYSRMLEVPLRWCFSVIIVMEIPLPELGLRVIILAGRRDSSRYHKGVLLGASMLRLRQWQLLVVALLVCLAPLGCGSGGHTSAGSAANGGSVATGGESTRGGSVTTGGGGTSGAPGSNGSTVPASPTPSTATGSRAPASSTSSTLPTYNQNTVSPTAKPTRPSDGVISLGNIGSPTVDSRHPNGSAGHMIPAGISPLWAR